MTLSAERLLKYSTWESRPGVAEVWGSGEASKLTPGTRLVQMPLGLLFTMQGLEEQ